MMKHLLKKISKGFLQITKILAVAAMFAFVLVKSPQMHGNFIRHYVGKNVVKVMGPRGGGSGFQVVAPSGNQYIMTNNHICLLADKKDMLDVYLLDAKYPIKRKVIKRLPHHDLCLLEPIDGLRPLSVANNVSVGEMVGLIGHPGLRPLTLSKGEVIGTTVIELIFGVNMSEEICIGTLTLVKDMPNNFFKVLLESQGIESVCVAKLRTNMLNAISYGGNSGSPVVNIFGNVIGVLFAGNRSQPTDAYLVPLDVIKSFLKDM